jgi:protein gp37
MSDKSAIAWTDATLNPTTGCQQVSPGCDACYARTLVNTRLSKNPKSIRFGTAFEQVMLHPERLATVLQWKRPRRIFMNSLSDLFHRGLAWKPLALAMGRKGVVALASSDRFWLYCLG